MLPEIHLKFPIHIWMGRIDTTRENPLKPLVDSMPPLVGQKPFEQACSEVQKPPERYKKQPLLQIFIDRHNQVFSQLLVQAGSSQLWDANDQQPQTA